MIQNERQYEVAKKKLAVLEQAQGQAEATPHPALPPRAQRAGINGMRALIGDLQMELEEYERLQATRCAPKARRPSRWRLTFQVASTTLQKHPCRLLVK